VVTPCLANEGNVTSYGLLDPSVAGHVGAAMRLVDAPTKQRGARSVPDKLGTAE
jgi:hypothetical protein